MKRASLLAIVSLACVAIIISLAIAQTKGGGFSDASGVQDGWYDNSIALVVGINSYSHGWNQLSKAVSDGKKTAAALRKRGFTVHELYNKQATGPAIIRQLRKAARETGSKDRFIFFYSGHGYIEKSGFDNRETGYLVPVEGRSGDTTSYIPMEQLKMELTNNSRAKHTLVILDSCFSGLVLTRSNIPTATVSEYLNKRGIYGITAGMPNHKAVDGLFTDKLLEGLEGNADNDGDGYITFKELGAYAERNVKFINSRQIPVYDVMAGAGQMVFARAGASSTAATAPAPPTYTPPITDYGAVAKAQEEANRKKRQDASEKAYTSLKRDVRENTGLSLSSKNSSYRQYLNDYPSDNPWYDEVTSWIHENQTSKLIMVEVPESSFLLGCTGSGCSKDYRKQKIHLDRFFIDRTETTFAQYRECVKANICPPSSVAGNPVFDQPTNPVIGIDWQAARKYCNYLGKRLPTEAEWEAAARGNEEYRFPWGNNFRTCLNARKQDGYEKTSPVDAFPCGESPFGVLGMAGNVSEWVAEGYSDTDLPPYKKLAKGAKWNTSALDKISLWNRSFYRFDTASLYVGFRCAADEMVLLP